MVKTYIQYWYAMTKDVAETVNIIHDWFKNQKGAKIFDRKKDKDELESLDYEQGNPMRGIYKPSHKKRTLITCVPALDEWKCPPGTEWVLKVQVYSTQVGSITKGKHLKLHKIWHDGYYKELFDKLGGTPLQLLLEPAKKKDEGSRVIALGDGSLPQDYGFVEN